MNTKEAVIHVLQKEGISKYKLAKVIGVSPIMIDCYLFKTRMRNETAAKFFTAYGIEIADTYPSPVNLHADPT